MAYTNKKLNVLSYALGSGFTLWYYETEDTLNEVLGRIDYFTEARDLFREKDQIMFSTMDTAGTLVVQCVDNTNETITLQLITKIR